MTGIQLSFLGEPTAAEAKPAVSFEVDEAFVERIRRELVGTLATVTQANGLPWPDLTQATLAEMRFRSIARYLPDDEADRMRSAFDKEMDRLYEIEDRVKGGA